MHLKARKRRVGGGWLKGELKVYRCVSSGLLDGVVPTAEKKGGNTEAVK